MPLVPTSLAARMVLAALVFGCATAAVAESFAASIPEVIAIVGARDDVRGLVLGVKKRFKDSDPESLKAQDLYQKAYGRYDAWITVLAAGIVAGGRQDLRADNGYREAVKAAGLAGAQFSNYVESLPASLPGSLPAGSLPGVSKSVPTVIAYVFEKGIILYTSWRAAALKERTQLADYIAGRAKWDTWEAIKVERESPAGTSPSGTAAAGAPRQPERPQPGPSERWALIAGVGAYDDPYIQRLHGDADAVDFAAALKDRAGFPGDHIILLAGQDADDCLIGAGRAREKSTASTSPSRACVANRTNLVNNLYRITQQVPADGLFVFYFSGHGRFVDGESLLYTSEVRSGSDSYVKEQGLSASIIAEGIHVNHIKRVLIFLDACRNQFLVTQGTREERASPDFKRGFDLDQLNANVEAFMTFFSTSAGSASYEDPRENRSYFTSEIVHALNGDAAAYDAHNVLTLGNLIHYVQSRVKSRVAEERRASQVPDFQLRGFLADELVLARRP